MKKKKKTKIIAPRLYNNHIRIKFGHGLPEEIKEGLKEIARKDNISMSYLLEEIIIDYFNLPRPKYKNKNKMPLLKF